MRAGIAPPSEPSTEYGGQAAAVVRAIGDPLPGVPARST